MTHSLIAALLAVSLAQELTPAQVTAVKDHYKKLGSAAVEAKPSPPLPSAAKVTRVDVSPRMRSASFGHKTTLLVPLPPEGQAPRRYWVEYGKSTNRPATLYGPFMIEPAP